jgi:hypothetical protein
LRELSKRLPPELLESVFLVHVDGAPPVEVAAAREVTTRSLKNWEHRMFRTTADIMHARLALIVVILSFSATLALLLQARMQTLNAPSPATDPESDEQGDLVAPGWLREAYGCTARNWFIEHVRSDRAILNCPQRDRLFQQWAVGDVERHDELDPFYTALHASLDDVKSGDTTALQEVLRALAIPQESVRRLVDDLEQAYDVSCQTLAVDRHATDRGRYNAACTAAVSAGRPAPRLTLERVHTERCADDVGLEWGCDGEELLVVWAVVGASYVGYGISPMLEGVRRDHPVSPSLPLEPIREWGDFTGEAALFVAVVEVDPGGDTPQHIAEVAGIVAATAHALRDPAECDLSPDWLRATTSALTLMMRVSAGESDEARANYRVLRCEDGEDCRSRQTFAAPTLEQPYNVDVTYDSALPMGAIP